MNFSTSFIWSPSDYAESAVIAREAGDEMLARLDLVTLQPSVILDAGCGNGEMSVKLQQRYPEAQVLALDLSESMLAAAQQHISRSICADAERLPLRAQSVDLVFANFLIPWHANFKQLLREWRRVLKADGLLIFTALGPDTLREYRDELGADNVPMRMDMHEVGDLLLQVGFADPVMDVSYFTTSYQEKNRLLHELRMSGMLVGHDAVELVPTPEGKWDVTYEVVFAHTFAPQPGNEFGAGEDGVARIPLAALRR